MYQQCIQSITKKACDWIELETENYNLTIKTALEDPKQRQELNQKDSEARTALEDKPLEQSEEDAVSASKFKFNRDIDMFKKI